MGGCSRWLGFLHQQGVKCKNYSRLGMAGPGLASFLSRHSFSLVGLALGFAFWTMTAPVAKAREMMPVEMIQSKLPSAKTLVTASKPEVLFAVCGAIREWTNEFQWRRGRRALPSR
jgi:hypothetical protein